MQKKAVLVDEFIEKKSSRINTITTDKREHKAGDKILVGDRASRSDGERRGVCCLSPLL